MREIRVDQLEFLATGAAVLGAGGGGDPYVGKLMARTAMTGRPPVPLLDVDEIGDDDLVIPVAMMGAPTVIVEKLPSGHELTTAFRALEALFGRKARATMSIEAGGVNSLVPFVTAAELSLPVVDADFMGRAFPELQMVTPTLAGIAATQMAIADDKGNSVILNTIDGGWTESFARGLTVTMGATACVAVLPLTGRQLKEAAIPGTMTLIERIGREIREAFRDKRDPIAAVANVTDGFPFWRGKVSDIERRTEGGFARGTARIEGLGEFAGGTLSIDFQNEFLIARTGDRIYATVPDLITLLDAETGEPITTESIRYGFRVVAVGIPCAAQWRSPEGLALVGPAYFNYRDVPYIPIEERLGV